MQGLMVEGFIVDEILRVGLKNDSHWSMKYRSRSVGQCGCRVGTFEEKSYVRFDSSRLYSCWKN